MPGLSTLSEHLAARGRATATAATEPVINRRHMPIGTLLDELERRDQGTGLVTMCSGGGMGIATILERV